MGKIMAHFEMMNFARVRKLFGAFSPLNKGYVQLT